MTGDEATSWPGGESYENLEAMADDDFSKFLDLENIDFDFPALDPDTSYAAAAPDNSHGIKFADYDTADNGTHHGQHTPGFDGAMPVVTEAQTQNGYQQYQWNHAQQHSSHNSIPPTPHSSEMYPNSYNHQHTGAGHRYHDSHPFNHKDPSFTPLTSPQFMDHGASTSVHDYAMADRHAMSPLTSPAIYAQKGSVNRETSSAQSMTAGISMTGSPIELDQQDAGTESAVEERPRKTRRKEPASAKPVKLPVRKRRGSVGSTKNATKSQANARTAASRPTSVHIPSNPPSISPQLQPDFSMPPPPVPSSARSSPYMFPSSGSVHSNNMPPATPASLMRLAKQQFPISPDARSPNQPTSGSPTTEALGLGMEELTLPEAAATSIASTRSGAQGARATPAILPRIPNGGTATLQSPRTSSFGNTSKNPAGRGGSRKRNGTTSQLVSPAILPRIISPNIQPLLPENGRTPTTMASEEMTAQLLTTRSNYQNLVEGTTVPGMNYPVELSTNLTSKRTSHKIAEQGRRNRINNALHEMQTLLPASLSLNGNSPTGDGSGSGSGEATSAKTPATPAQQANSKAATVELAIEYIKTLRSENEAASRALSARDAEIEALRQQLNNSLEPTREQAV